MEQVAVDHWGSFGPVAVPGLSETEFGSDLDETTTIGTGIRSPKRYARVVAAKRVNSVVAQRTAEHGLRGSTRTVDLDTRQSRRLNPQARLKEIFTAVLCDESGEGITMEMRIDALRFLSRIPLGTSMPNVEFGKEEITFQWHHGQVAVSASVEGDGLLGYALLHQGRFIPGKGPEDLKHKVLPDDLLVYLKGFPAE